MADDKSLSAAEKQLLANEKAQFRLNRALKNATDQRTALNLKVAEGNTLTDDEIKLRAELSQAIKDQERAVKKLQEVEKRIRKEEEERNKALAKQKELLDKLNTATADLTGINVKQLSSVTGLTTAFMEQAKAINTAQTELRKTTGYAKALDQDMMNLAKSNKALGATAGEAAKVVGGLTTGFREFATLAPAQRGQIEQMAIEFEAMGVAAASTGRVMDIFSRGMGMTASAAAEATYSLDQFAQQVGLPTSQVMADLEAIGPQMARFGSQGKEEFQKLTKEARKMGIAVQDAFNLAEAFDTFEGAADLAGRLNAQIGLQLNSVDLMRASHGDRLKMLKKEFDLRGKNFDTMGRRQRQAIAEVMGVDVDMASRIFGDPVELRKYQKEQQATNERAKQFTDISKKLSAALQNLAIQFQPVIDGFITFMTFIAENQGIALLLGLVAAFIALAMAAGQIAPILPLLGIGLSSTAASSAAAAPAIAALGGAMKVAAPFLLKGALAMVPLAAAFWILSKSLTNFAAVAWGDLGKAGVVLIGLTAAMFGLGALIGNPVGATLFGVGILGILGLSIAMSALGASLMLVGSGLSMIGDTADAFDKIIKVTTQVDASGLETMDKVVDQIVRVGAVAQGGTAGILSEVAAAIQTAAGAMVNAPAPVVNGNVILDGRKLGNFVADSQNKRNSLTQIS